MTPDHDLSPRVLAKTIHAAVNSSSFCQSEADLEALAELSISSQRVRRCAILIGDERIADREHEIEQWRQLPLPTQRTSPTGHSPNVACIQLDGGRIQIRDRRLAQRAKVRRKRNGKDRFWKETKVGVLLSMSSCEHSQDPCPRIPETFIDLTRIEEISREIKGYSSQPQEDENDDDGEETLRVRTESQRPERAVPLVKSVVATCQNSEALGLQLAAAAYERGFAAAQRKVFVADGQACNWTIWKKHFSHYVPILDFVHAICYVFSAAMADGETKANWHRYCRWAQWLWEGNAQHIIDELAEIQSAVGLPTSDEGDTPRKRIAETLRYLRNQKSRTNYADYRRRGLPITSCYIESTIKQINRRVKGTEKFWSTAAEQMLQLTADEISETSRVERFWKRRPEKLTGMRNYRTSA